MPRLPPGALALTLKHLQLLVVGEQALKLLLGGLQRVQDEAECVTAILVARKAGGRLVLDPLDQAHWPLRGHGFPRERDPKAKRCSCGLLERAGDSLSVGSSPEHVPVEMEDRLARAGAHVDEDPIVLESGDTCGLRHEAGIRPASSSGKSEISLNVSTCRCGSTRRCVSEIGLMSRIATKPSALCTWSPCATSRQKRQSSGGDGRMPSFERDRAHRRPAHLGVQQPRRVIRPVPAARPIDEHTVGRSHLRFPAPVAGSSESARSWLLRSFFTCGGTESSAAVAVPGRGEYGNTWTS